MARLIGNACKFVPHRQYGIESIRGYEAVLRPNHVNTSPCFGSSGRHKVPEASVAYGPLND